MIFLSASIPEVHENEYYDTADIVAIRDAVRALATIVIPKSNLVWGGHPAITPLIRYVLTNMNVESRDRVTLYQSEEFIKEFPPDNKYFEKVIITPRSTDRESSLALMRNEMLANKNFSAGIFIGGKKGVIDEFEIFRERYPKAKIFPIASTGAAAKIIYDTYVPPLDKRLLNEYAYMALFRSLFSSLL